MKKEEIIPLIIHHMLQFKQPFTKQELAKRLKQEGILIENMSAMMNHFVSGDTVVMTGDKFQVNVKPLFS